MIFIILFTWCIQLYGVVSETRDANGVSLAEKVEAMERQLLTPGTLDFPVSPCSFLLNDNPDRGQQTSAEWVRIIFHDAITHDKVTGTGGLDASISFEFDREENAGVSFINATIIAFAQFFDVFTSMADLIALGVADSLISCDPNPRLINLRVGRTDATAPGPTGVPGPSDTVDFATKAFDKAGFNSSEMIQAIACGHSLGAVHHSDFPDIVENSTRTSKNLDGAESFDSTPDVFDNTGVMEYLNWTGKRGGPLVVGHNETTRSDLRIFSSDHNVTIRAMSAPQTFRDTCFTIFEKLINTVPKTVTLSDVIGPRPFISRDLHLDLSSTGEVRFEGNITGHAKVNIPDTVSYFYGTSGGGNTSTRTGRASGSQSSRPFGTITEYTINDTLSNPNITSINIGSSYTTPINQNVFVQVSRSFRSPILNDVGAIVKQQFVIRAAVLAKLSPKGTIVTATVYHPASQVGTVAPKIARISAIMTLAKTIGTYNIYQVVVSENTQVPLGASFVDIKVGTQTSAKFQGDNFELCTNSVLTNC